MLLLKVSEFFIRTYNSLHSSLTPESVLLAFLALQSTTEISLIHYVPIQKPCYLMKETKAHMKKIQATLGYYACTQ